MAYEVPARIPHLDEDAVLRTILEGTATETGERFFKALVKNLAVALGTYGAWVTEYYPEKRTLLALAFWMDQDWVQGWEMAIDGTPCESVIETSQLVHFPENVIGLFPQSSRLRSLRAVSYMGVPLKDSGGKILGHLAVLDKKAMPKEPRLLTVFRIFAARAGAELQRLNAEKGRVEREQQLGGIVSSALDAIVEINQDHSITLVNPAGEKAFGCTGEAMLGQPISQYFTVEDYNRFLQLIAHLDALPGGEQCVWVPGGLRALRTDGKEFAAEATVSRFEMHGRLRHTIILRNVDDRLAAERRIQSLAGEAEYLRQELRERGHVDDLLGSSAALHRVIDDIAQVAKTDATVLIFGETGTGKELIARAIHEASARHDGPLIRVNCAAIPAMLMESEFFGHEKGAFTGASSKREGRFALADGGTIFLDEIGELSLDLQAKLLRVLQEGEFEPVGSSTTRRVSVRVLAATNRDLKHLIAEGKFRDDLYYRLNVFPIRVPPLRDRGDDIVLLATSFAERMAKQMGKTLAPLASDSADRLKAYHWPGNVRELQNVIEHAVITATNGHLNISRALPETGATPVTNQPRQAHGERVLTEDEFRELERTNIIRALESAGWRVAGEQGAAHLLGANPSTLASRMKTLGIQRPR